MCPEKYEGCRFKPCLGLGYFFVQLKDYRYGGDLHAVNLCEDHEHWWP